MPKTGKCYIDGKWVGSKNMIAVENPATKETIGQVPNLGAKETKSAIEAAKQVLPEWEALGGFARASYLQKFFKAILARVDKDAETLSKENGKSLKEARGEILYGASYFELYAEEAKRIHGEILGSQPGQHIQVTREAVGVVGLITPWNFPQAMLARKMSAALAAGCTVVAKPSEFTPYSALVFAEIAEEIALPPGVLNILTGNAQEIGGELCNSSDVRKISFTGSTRVGKLLMSQSAQTLKKLSLELGGNAPFIVFEDADLEKAIEGAMASKYRNAGQTCVCTNRFLVHESLVDKFVSGLKKKVSALKMGDALKEDIDVGPLIHQQALDKVNRLLAQAEAQGAKIWKSTDKTPKSGYFSPCYIVENASRESDLYQEEIFGPVSAIYTFSREEEAIEEANSTPYGLAAYFYSQNPERIHRVTKALHFGMVGVNSGRVSSAWAPFGGVKESGFGKEGGSYGIREYLNEKMSIQLV